MPSLHLTNLVVSVPALLPLVTHLSPSSPPAPPPSFLPSPPPWLHQQLPCDFGRVGAPRSRAFETSLWSQDSALGMLSCWEALAWSSHLSLAASEKRWGETGLAGDGDGASPLLPQLESLEMLWVEKASSSRWRSMGVTRAGGTSGLWGLGCKCRAGTSCKSPLGTFRCHWLSAKTPVRLGCHEQHCQLLGNATLMGAS